MTDLFISCLPGLEPMLLGEIAGHHIGTNHREVPGGVELEGSLQDVHRANLLLGLAQQVRVRVAVLKATKLPELARKARAIEWDQYLRPDLSLRVRATTKKSKLYHGGAVAERVAAGIAGRLGAAPEEGDAQQVHVRVEGVEVTLSVDASGDPLHRRGYRLESAKAPLREDLARALVLFSGWDGRSPLVDPMMGSGTIVIEAAMLAAGIPPGRGRTFAAESFPATDLADLEALRAVPPSANDAPLIRGSDRDAGAVKMAQANAARAGVEVHFERAALASTLKEWSAPNTTVVTNPPYGRRVGRGDLRPLYQTLGRLVREHADWTLAMVTPEGSPMARQVGIDWSATCVTRHGGQRVQLQVGKPSE